MKLTEECLTRFKAASLLAVLNIVIVVTLSPAHLTAAEKSRDTSIVIRLDFIGLDIYGSALIVKEEDIKRVPEMIRAYVEGTMEGLKYTRDHQEEALRILLKHKPELDKELTRIQIKNGVEEVFFIPAESVASGFGYMKPDVMEKTVKITNEFFDVGGQGRSRRCLHKPVYPKVASSITALGRVSYRSSYFTSRPLVFSYCAPVRSGSGSGSKRSTVMPVLISSLTSNPGHF